VAQHSCYLRAHYPAEFIAAVLANGGGYYHPFTYVAEAMRMGLTVLPPDVNASAFRCSGRDGVLRIGLQFVKELSAEGVERLLTARDGKDGKDGTFRPSALPPFHPFTSLPDLRARTGLVPSDLRALIKVGALDAIAHGWSRPMMLWEVDAEKGGKDGKDTDATLTSSPSSPPSLRNYSPDRRRREEHAAMGFITDAHPMRLHADALARFRLCSSTELSRHVGEHVLAAGMLTSAKPVHTITDEPMQFATFDDGDGLIETVLFPQVFRDRGHVLFDQGPFIFRGKVDEEFGVVTLTLTHLDRLERMLAKTASRTAGRPPAQNEPGASRRGS
jgi:DNA polymerase III alpha subunit